MSTGNTIRDFVYMNVERLYSLYSQVFEGVAEQIVLQNEGALTRSDSQRASVLKGATVEAQVAEVSRRTESKVLYDYMYNKLEEKLGRSVFIPEGLSRDNYAKALAGVAFIKVRGIGEIEDYSRLALFMEKYNEMAEAIAYFNAQNEETKRSVDELEAAVHQIKDKNERARVRSRLSGLKDPKQLAKTQGLSYPDKLMSYIGLFTKIFYPEGFEVTVMPEHGGQDVVFRGILDKRWLRLAPDLLRASYGGDRQASLVMVGQVTYIPAVEGSTDSPADEAVSVRGRFAALFGAMRTLEKAFLKSGERIEVVVSPIAIYRESELPGTRLASSETSEFLAEGLLVPNS